MQRQSEHEPLSGNWVRQPDGSYALEPGWFQRLLLRLRRR